jgi:hypothetical protein
VSFLSPCSNGFSDISFNNPFFRPLVHWLTPSSAGPALPVYAPITVAFYVAARMKQIAQFVF